MGWVGPTVVAGSNLNPVAEGFFTTLGEDGAKTIITHLINNVNWRPPKPKKNPPIDMKLFDISTMLDEKREGVEIRSEMQEKFQSEVNPFMKFLTSIKDSALVPRTGGGIMAQIYTRVKKEFSKDVWNLYTSYKYAEDKIYRPYELIDQFLLSLNNHMIESSFY